MPSAVSDAPFKPPEKDAKAKTLPSEDSEPVVTASAAASAAATSSFVQVKPKEPQYMPDIAAKKDKHQQQSTFHSCVLCHSHPSLLFSHSNLGCSDLPPPLKPPQPASDFKSDAYYGGKHDDKKQDSSGLGLDGFSAIYKKEKNPYSNIGSGYDEKKERKEGASVLGGSFGQKVLPGVSNEKYSLGNAGGSKWDLPLPSSNSKDLPSATGSNFPSVAGGRSSFIRNARYAPGVNPSSVKFPICLVGYTA
jgi:hypothetical protein